MCVLIIEVEGLISYICDKNTQSGPKIKIRLYFLTQAYIVKKLVVQTLATPELANHK